MWPFKPKVAAVPASPSIASVRPEVSERKATEFLVQVLGLLRSKREAPVQPRSLKLPPPAPGVVPKGRALMANDAQISAILGFGANAQWDGYGFMGYALLGELAQIPEYRRPSEILANEMTREWVELVSTGDTDKTEKLKELESELKRFQVREAFRQAFELDNFFGQSKIFPDLGASDQELLKPLLVEAKVGKNSLKGLRVIEPLWTYPNDYNSNDPTRADFYQPQRWFVLGKEIHASRLLQFNSRPVPDILKPAYMFGGVSLTQLLRAYVDNWLRTRQSVSDITHNFSTPVFQTDMGQVMAPGAAQRLATRVQVFNEARDNQGAFVLDKDKEGFINVSAPLGGLDKLQAQAQEQMAAIAGIPLVKLFGITPSGLNASSDGEIRVFYDTIKSVQERIGTPNLQYLLEIIQMNKYGEIDPDISFVWLPLWSLDEEKLAAVRKLNAETDQVYADAGIVDASEIRATIAAEEDSRYASIDVDDVPDLLEEEIEGLEPVGGKPELVTQVVAGATEESDNGASAGKPKT